ncbi:FAD-dependent monooxygenase [Brevibacterium sp. 91QC2O2]|uniref:FAD-dependent monooxygenase n=1 Tax=Brevibacterium sp. 91QC2O2 TaxID=2968458 RepID=UPI00211BA2A6|nr:FAD-dependent monooxygenase [Brevibacterium sp. 91QC2O2]
MNSEKTLVQGRSAIVVGASLSGLMTSLALARAGLEVTLLERSARKSRTGAALPVAEGLLGRLTGQPETGQQSVPSGAQAWTDIHAALRDAVVADARIDFRAPVLVTSVGEDRRSAWVSADGGEVLRADLLVGADGHRSVVRVSVSPDTPDAEFSGYVIWLGLVDESAISSPAWPSDLAILYEGDYCLNAYYLPGEDGSTFTGERRLGWGWYDAGHNELLRRSGVVKGNVVQRSMRPDDMPDSLFKDLARAARHFWPDPWREAILDCLSRRSIIGTPIGEYMPDRLVTERICLVGDAAHLPSPMTGSGFSASAEDAMALGDAIERCDDLGEALRRYEDRRLQAAQGLVRSGRSFSRSFAPRGAAQ